MGNALFMRKGAEHTAPEGGLLASSLAVGSTVKLMENGAAVEYLVVNQGKPSGSSLYDDSCNGTWLLRKDCHSNRAWDSTNNDYANSDIHAWLNNTFLALLGSVEQATIKQVKIPFVNGTGSAGSVASGASGLVTKVFLLTPYELGFTTTNSSYIYVDSAKLDYFIAGVGTDALSRRVANLNGAAVNWWTRGPYKYNTTKAFLAGLTGSWSSNTTTSSYAVRPALVLDSSAIFDEETLVLKGG